MAVLETTIHHFMYNVTIIGHLFLCYMTLCCPRCPDFFQYLSSIPFSSIYDSLFGLSISATTFIFPCF